jgi:hypothetical protein
MRGRVTGLLGDRSYVSQHEQFFDIRSAFLHSRAMNGTSTHERVMVRLLAHQVVWGLIRAIQSDPVSSREDFLDELIDIGCA